MPPRDLVACARKYQHQGWRRLVALAKLVAVVRVVTPFRPFQPESGAHQKLGAFDWIAALQMLRASVRAACDCETVALTDVDTALPGPTYAYVTHERRLMLWLIEVACCYLQSADFNEDTILISPDALVRTDLRGWFRADLGVMVRTGQKYVDKPLLNGVQCWRVAAQDRLVAFYTEALVRARMCGPASLKWGADTEPLVDLLSPIVAGPSDRAGLSVYGFEAMHAFRSVPMGRPRRLLVPQVPVLDFKSVRKRAMRQYFDALGLTEGACV